jgi:hypothetical protein
MRLSLLLLCAVLVLGRLAAPAAPLAAQAALGEPWDSVGRILQAPGVPAGGYYRYNLPRRDIVLRVGDVSVAPALALGAWAGFSGGPHDATMMGDLVVTSREIRPVLAELASQRINVTAVHNHLAGEDPQITYVHFHGEGDALDLAARLDRVIAHTATPRPVAAPPAQPLAIDTSAVFTTLGRLGTARGAVAQLSFILVPGTVTMDGRTVTPALGYGSPVNVQMVSPSRAVAAGDFAIPGAKLDAVLDALAAHGIVATGVHNHLVGESPRVYYVHFWADGALLDVLQGLKAAIDAAR